MLAAAYRGERGNTEMNCLEKVSQIILLSSVVLHFLLWQHSSLRSFEAGCGLTDEARRMNNVVITTTAKTINRKIAPILIVLVLF